VVFIFGGGSNSKENKESSYFASIDVCLTLLV
jgi:hypothetical protein